MDNTITNPEIQYMNMRVSDTKISNKVHDLKQVKIEKWTNIPLIIKDTIQNIITSVIKDSTQFDDFITFYNRNAERSNYVIENLEKDSIHFQAETSKKYVEIDRKIDYLKDKSINEAKIKDYIKQKALTEADINNQKFDRLDLTQTRFNSLREIIKEFDHYLNDLDQRNIELHKKFRFYSNNLSGELNHKQNLCISSKRQIERNLHKFKSEVEDFMGEIKTKYSTQQEILVNIQKEEQGKIKHDFYKMKQETEKLTKRFKDIDPIHLKSMVVAHKNIVSELEDKFKELESSIKKNERKSEQNELQISKILDKLETIEAKIDLNKEENDQSNISNESDLDLKTKEFIKESCASIMRKEIQSLYSKNLSRYSTIRTSKVKNMLSMKLDKISSLKSSIRKPEGTNLDLNTSMKNEAKAAPEKLPNTPLNDAQVYHNLVEQSLFNSNITELEEKIALIGSKVQRLTTTINQMNATKQLKVQNPIFETFRKHKNFIQDNKKRTMTVDKAIQRPIIRNLNVMKETQERQGRATIEIKEAERRLFSPSISNRNKLVKNPRTLANDFSVNFTDLKFQNNEKTRQFPLDLSKIRQNSLQSR
ncbi:unnamed protein product [Moneuplotes crassus]|uniref:Uncharacterized protein n=1 Tax=Euplotes crassus TaxID=5936 RepID=A0AAD1X6C9_EUPCR|nr:unnamed protein product [Moneuplotes crassus]